MGAGGQLLGLLLCFEIFNLSQELLCGFRTSDDFFHFFVYIYSLLHDILKLFVKQNNHELECLLAFVHVEELMLFFHDLYF